MENQEKVRKIRATPMRWERFFRVTVGETVYHGKKRVIKSSFFTAVTCATRKFLGGEVVWVNPFRRVKTTKPVKRAEIAGEILKAITKSSPFVGLLKGGPFPGNLGNTHFVSDDCPGGHHELPKQVGDLQQELASVPEGPVKAALQRELDSVAAEIGMTLPHGGHHPVPAAVTGRLNTRENVQNIPRGGEPHNSNNITGPTS